MYDKTGLVPFAEGLQALGAEIIATGNTLRMLQEAGVQAAAVSDITGFPEILDGRVKSLHPHIHGGNTGPTPCGGGFGGHRSARDRTHRFGGRQPVSLSGGDGGRRICGRPRPACVGWGH